MAHKAGDSIKQEMLVTIMCGHGCCRCKPVLYTLFGIQNKELGGHIWHGPSSLWAIAHKCSECLEAPRSCLYLRAPICGIALRSPQLHSLLIIIDEKIA